MTTFQAVIALVALTAVCSFTNVIAMRKASAKFASRLLVVNNYICWSAVFGMFFVAPKAAAIVLGFVAVILIIAAVPMLIGTARMGMSRIEALKFLGKIYMNAFRTQLGFKPVGA